MTTDAPFDRELSLALDGLTVALEATTDETLRLLVLKRRTAIEAQIFSAYESAVAVEARPDAETWEVIRQAVLRRDGHRCRVCGATGRTLQVHHLLELSRGGRTEPSNLLTLCKDCHALIHPWLQAA